MKKYLGMDDGMSLYETIILVSLEKHLGMDDKLPFKMDRFYTKNILAWMINCPFK
jgi:hypothetical protein